MNRVAVFESSHFAITRAWIDGLATFRREAAALPAEAFVAWPERRAYTLGWQVFPFAMAGVPTGLEVDFAANRSRCPATWSILQHARVVCAGFSRLLPGCHIYPHYDGPEPDELRFHLGLRSDGNAGLRIEGRTMLHNVGASFVFDSGCLHEAGNLGALPRDLLLVDFKLTAAEMAFVQQVRQAGAGNQVADF